MWRDVYEVCITCVCRVACTVCVRRCVSPSMSPPPPLTFGQAAPSAASASRSCAVFDPGAAHMSSTRWWGWTRVEGGVNRLFRGVNRLFRGV